MPRKRLSATAIVSDPLADRLACPFTTLYWDFVDRHAELFRANPRMATIVAAWRRRDEAARSTIRARAAEVRAMADAGTL